MQIVDHILKSAEFNIFQNYIMSFDFPWNYGRKATRETNEKDNPYLIGWQCIAFNHGRWLYDPHRLIENTVTRVLSNANEKIDTLLRVRLILNTIADKPYENGVHIDEGVPHKTALLYINDSDGDTIVYKEKYDCTSNFVSDAYLKNTFQTPTVLDTVKAKANRLLIFDGLHYHTGTLPTQTARRVVMNINYIPA